MIFTRREKFDRGFSLTEMSIVLVIIGILIIFALPYFTGTIDEVKIQRTRILMDQVAQACQKYAFDNSGNYPERISFLKPKYLSEIPKSPWGNTIEISFGSETEINCYIRWGNDWRKLSKHIDNLGFDLDNRHDISDLRTSAFSIYKSRRASQSGEVNLYNVRLEIEFNSVITPKTVELGSDFRFSIDNADITEVTSAAGVPSFIKSQSDAPDMTYPILPGSPPDSKIAIESSGGYPARCFEYSSKSASDKISVTMKGCRRSTNFKIQIYRPGDEGIPIYYGEKKILEVAPGSTIPITFSRLVAESTKSK